MPLPWTYSIALNQPGSTEPGQNFPAGYRAYRDNLVELLMKKIDAAAKEPDSFITNPKAVEIKKTVSLYPGSHQNGLKGDDYFISNALSGAKELADAAFRQANLEIVPRIVDQGIRDDIALAVTNALKARASRVGGSGKAVVEGTAKVVIEKLGYRSVPMYSPDPNSKPGSSQVLDIEISVPRELVSSPGRAQRLST